ncbi:MAG: aspartate/glutamate racemase family protein [Granulosicoccus sp.]
MNPSSPKAIKRIGMLTPSSNTVLEPYTSEIFAQIPDLATVHYARFKVTEISMSKASVGQFDHEKILDAAHCLADAKVDCIAWNGTSAAWLGMEQDKILCERITAETGIPATSTMASFADATNRLKATNLALITPYKTEIQDRIIAQYEAAGYHIVHSQCLEDSGNFSFASYSEAHIKELALAATVPRPDAVLIVCTNFRGATIATDIEAVTGIPVLDSVSVTSWKTLQMIDINPALVLGWGKIFTL